MALDRSDLQFFADDIKTTIRDAEGRLSARIGVVEEKTDTNTVDVAVLKANSQATRSMAATFGASLGAAASVVMTFIYQWVFGTPPPK